MPQWTRPLAAPSDRFHMPLEGRVNDHDQHVDGEPLELAEVLSAACRCYDVHFAVVNRSDFG